MKILPRQIEDICRLPRVTDAEVGRMIRYLLTGEGKLPERLEIAVELATRDLASTRTAGAERQRKARANNGK